MYVNSMRYEPSLERYMSNCPFLKEHKAEAVELCKQLKRREIPKHIAVNFIIENMRGVILSLINRRHHYDQPMGILLSEWAVFVDRALKNFDPYGKKDIVNFLYTGLRGQCQHYWRTRNHADFMKPEDNYSEWMIDHLTFKSVDINERAELFYRVDYNGSPKHPEFYYNEEP